MNSSSPSNTKALKFTKIRVCDTVSDRKKTNSTTGITHDRTEYPNMRVIRYAHSTSTAAETKMNSHRARSGSM